MPYLVFNPCFEKLNFKNRLRGVQERGRQSFLMRPTCHLSRESRRSRRQRFLDRMPIRSLPWDGKAQGGNAYGCFSAGIDRCLGWGFGNDHPGCCLGIRVARRLRALLALPLPANSILCRDAYPSCVLGHDASRGRYSRPLSPRHCRRRIPSRCHDRGVSGRGRVEALGRTDRMLGPAGDCLPYRR